MKHQYLRLFAIASLALYCCWGLADHAQKMATASAFARRQD